MKVIPVKICQVSGCKNPARYGMYQLGLNGDKRWLYVCEECEKRIGEKNLELQGVKDA